MKNIQSKFKFYFKNFSNCNSTASYENLIFQVFCYKIGTEKGLKILIYSLFWYLINLKKKNFFFVSCSQFCSCQISIWIISIFYGFWIPDSWPDNPDFGVSVIRIPKYSCAFSFAEEAKKLPGFATFCVCSGKFKANSPAQFIIQFTFILNC